MDGLRAGWSSALGLLDLLGGDGRPGLSVQGARIDDMTDAARINQALTIGRDFGQTDGAHHKAWVIDQMVRALTGDEYEQFISDYSIDENGETYTWDVGIAP